MAGESTTAAPCEPTTSEMDSTHGQPRRSTRGGVDSWCLQQLLLEVDRRTGLHKRDDGRLSMSPFDTEDMQKDKIV